MFEYLIMLSIVIAISEFVKMIRLLNQNYIPLLNIIISFCLSFGYFGLNSLDAAQIGVTLGLIATGLCSTVYHTALLFEKAA